jgi:hypothetical protein
MPDLNIYSNSDFAEVKPLSIKRDWMDETFDRHAYRCFPVSIANMLGWYISFPEDIEFIWDGISDSTPDHVTITKGEKYVHANRANATISFNTGLTVKTENNVSLLIMPVPNQFIDGVQSFTTIISTSILQSDLPCAWHITKANTPILIPANTPISSFIPISINSVESFSLNLYDKVFDQKHMKYMKEYGEASQSIVANGGWTDFYRNAKDHNNMPIGQHEAKTIKLKLNDYRKKYYE